MRSASDEVLLRYQDPETGRSVVLEDDGRVAYAYLLDRPMMPFLNPRALISEESMGRLTAESQIFCAWSSDGVEISIDGAPLARLANGSKPGWSRLAALPGPLAKPFQTPS